MKTFSQLRREAATQKEIDFKLDESLISFFMDEEVDDTLKQEVFVDVFGDDVVFEAIDWDALGKGFAQGLTFDNAPKIKAKVKSWAKGTKYADELEKERSDYEKAKERSPGTYTAGEVGSMLVPAGGAVLGAAKAARAGKAAITGMRATAQANKAAKAAKQVSAAEKAVDAAQKAKSAANTGKNIKNVANAEKKLSSAAQKEQKYTNNMKDLLNKQSQIKKSSILKPTVGRVAATVAGAGALNVAKSLRGVSMDDVKQKASDTMSDLQNNAKNALNNFSGSGSSAKPASKPEDDNEKRIKELNATRSNLAKQGIGTGTETKTWSDRNPSGPQDKYDQAAKQKYNEFVRKRDEDLTKKLQDIQNRPK